MCSREFIDRCWYSLIFTGSTRLKTPPTGLSAHVGSSLIWPSEISWIWFSLSCSVIFFMSLSMRRSTSRLAAPRDGCSAASSLDCVAATTPPASAVPNTTMASTNPTLRLPLMRLPLESTGDAVPRASGIEPR